MSSVNLAKVLTLLAWQEYASQRVAGRFIFQVDEIINTAAPAKRRSAAASTLWAELSELAPSDGLLQVSGRRSTALLEAHLD